MKKILLIAAFAVACFSVSAEVLSPYTEQFENQTARPRGWLIGYGSSWAPATFTSNTEGGHSGGYISVNQYGNSWNSWSSYYSYADVLITPKVEGEVSIWVRQNGDAPTLTFYTFTDLTNIGSASSFKMLAGTDKNLVEGKSLDDWTQITVSKVPEGTYLGIRAHNLDIDEFTATKAEVEYRPGILDVSVDLKSDEKTLEADSDNNITFDFTVTVTNTGDLDFPGGEPGLNITLKNVPLEKVFGTGNITDAIPWGGSVSKDFKMTGPAEADPSSATTQFKLYVSKGDDTPVEASLGYFTIIPYKPVVKMMFFEDNDKNLSSYNDVNINDEATIGAGPAGTTSRTLYLWNQGTAPMNVTSVTAGEGFTTDVTEAFTLEPKGKKAIKVSLADTPGFKQDTLRVNVEGLEQAKYAIQGLVTEEGKYSENFDAKTLPAGMVISPGVKHVNVPDILAPLGGAKYMEYTSTYGGTSSRVITPKLTFAEGEKFYFMATKKDNTSAKLVVYTSSDRVNWTEAKTIVASSYDKEHEHFNISQPTGTGYGTYEFRIFEIEMPAGDSYVAFELYGACLDNLYGGTKVEMAHDLYLVNYAVPTAAEVNTRFITSATIRNLMPTAETDYKVQLKVGDEIVATAAETPELTFGAEATYELRYTPHAEGTYTGQMLFVAGEDVTVLHTFEIVVGPEKAEATYQVGDFKITATDPLNTIYNAQGQIIYRAADLGMEEGMKITGFTFSGYNETELKKNVKVWITNTEVDKFDSADIQPLNPEQMTLVYDGEYTFAVGGDSRNKEYVPMFTVPFSTPFTYTGKNVVIMIQQTDLTEGQENSHVFIGVDNSKYDYYNDIYDDRVIRNQKDYADDLIDDPSWSVYRVGFPVTYFSVAKEVAVLKGSVKDEFGKAIQGARVVINSDDLQYSGLSNSEGEYSMSVANIGETHVYVATATAEGFDAATAEGIKFSEETLEVTKDFVLNYTNREATLEGVVTTSLEEDDAVFGAVVTLKSGDSVYSTSTDEDGKYTLTVAEFTGEYDLTVTVDEVEYLSEKFTFGSKSETKDLSIAWTGPATLKGKVTSSIDDGAAIEAAVVTLTDKDGKAVSATTDAEGKYSLTAPKYAADYTLTVTVGEQTFFNESFKFTQKEQVKNFSLEYSSIAEIKAAVSEGTVYDLKGRKVSKACKGVYIVNGVKTLVR